MCLQKNSQRSDYVDVYICPYPRDRATMKTLIAAKDVYLVLFGYYLLYLQKNSQQVARRAYLSLPPGTGMW